METNQPDIPPELLAEMQRRHAISELTSDEVTRDLWSRWNERTPGRIDLVLRGQISWKSQLKTECDVGLGWIRPNLFEPVDTEVPNRFSMPPYEYGAGVPVNDATDATDALPAIRTAVGKASFMTDALSFLTGFSVTWRPARILNVVDRPEPPSHDGVERRYKKYFAMPLPEDNTSFVLTDELMTTAYRQLLTLVWNLSPVHRNILVTAISWQAQANRVPGFSRYVHYWSSIELLASFFWNHLPRDKTGKVPESETRQKILEQLIDVKSNTYLEIVKKCADLLQPSARTQIKSLAKLIDFDSDIFFTKASKDDRSLYDIRNDIAHGNVANDDRAYADTHREAFQKYNDQTREFVIRVAIAAAAGKLTP